MSTTKDIVIVGAGGFGREVFGMIHDINRVERTWNVLGFLDDHLNALEQFKGYPPVLGTLDDFAHMEKAYLACAIGSPTSRKSVVDRLNAMDARWATLVHPTADVGLTSTIGTGCILCSRSLVTMDAHVGEHTHVNNCSTVGHDARVGNFCTLSGYVDICGHVVVEDGVFFGSHASVLPSARIGAWAIVGAGSIVLKDLSAGVTAYGVPAKARTGLTMPK